MELNWNLTKLRKRLFELLNIATTEEERHQIIKNIGDCELEMGLYSKEELEDLRQPA